MKAVVTGALAALDGLNRGVYYVIGILLAVISAVVLYQVIVRFVLTAAGINIAAPWTEELARYLLVWMVFLGAGVGCRRMQLIALDFVVKALPPAAGLVVRLVALGLCLWMFWLLLRYGTQFVDMIGWTEKSPVMQLTKAWVYLAMPVGAVLMIANTLAFLAEGLIGARDMRLSTGIGDFD